MYSMSTLKSQTRATFLKFCIAACLLTISAATVTAATYTVSNVDDSGPGSLRQAIFDANASTEDDVINFDPIVFASPQTITLTSGELTITNNGSLMIGGPTAGVTISGNNQSRVFLIHESANATISDLTITGGNGVGAIFQAVSIGVGGGILNYRGTLTLNNATVSGNSTPTGGGGIFSARGTTVISNSTISNNSAAISGGGIYSSWLTISNSTVSGNTATAGGGIFAAVNGVTITNSTVSTNLAERGGGIYINMSTSMTLTNSTVSGNSATNFGGGIVTRDSSITTLTNTIIANSTSGGDCIRANGTINAEYSLFEDGLGCVNGTNVNNLTGDPMLGPLQDNGGMTYTHALLPGSPAFNAGSNLLIPAGVATDQRGAGFPRIGGGTVYLGAFEVVICPNPQGYWKNNPEAWPVDTLTLGDETYSKAELLVILNTPAGTGRNADASLILAYQLIAAKLNAASGADTDSVDATIAAADTLLASLGGQLPLRVRSSSTNGQMMVGYGKILDAFNKATTTLGCSQ